MGIYQDKICIHDNILNGFTNDDIITAVLSNEPIINEQTVTKVYNELVRTQLQNARETLQNNMSEILRILKDNR